MQKNYIMKICFEFRNDTKKTWTVINTLINNNKTNKISTEF